MGLYNYPLYLGHHYYVTLLWMLSSSMKVEGDVFNFPIEWIPRKFNIIENYKEVWVDNNFAVYYWNSIKITVISTLAQLIVSAMAAYGFTKIEWKGRDAIFFIYIATMMIPKQVTIVPQFIVLRTLNLYNTHLGMILMISFSVFGVFLLRQNMLSIPTSLSEAAKIDGASHMKVFVQIILPLVKPALATTTILKFIWTWNDYQTPLVFLSDRKLFTVQLGMRLFATESGSYYSLIMAAAVSAILPLIVIFLLGQRQIVEGIVSGAVKG